MWFHDRLIFTEENGMKRWHLLVMGLVMALAALPCPVRACVLCGNLKSRQTLRGELKLAKIVIYGELANPRLGEGAAGKGTTELHVLKVIKSHPSLDKRKTVLLQRYVPVLDPKKPPKYLVFFDIVNGQLDPYHGRPVDSKAILKYIEGAKHQRGKPRPQALTYFFKYLNHKDSAIADDAFLEFAKSSDAEVGQAARLLPAGKIRQLLVDPRTPAERLSLYAFLLGASGQKQDAEILRQMIARPTPRTRNALDGLLSGYIQLRPKEGWDLVVSILGDSKKGFLERYGAARVLSLYQNWQPKKSRPQIVRAASVMVDDGAIADLAINDLRRWKIWDLTGKILAHYGQKSHASPVTQRAILRYALCCPSPAAKRFVAQIRQTDPELIQEIAKSLALEKQ